MAQCSYNKLSILSIHNTDSDLILREAILLPQRVYNIIIWVKVQGHSQVPYTIQYNTNLGCPELGAQDEVLCSVLFLDVMTTEEVDKRRLALSAKALDAKMYE